MVEPAFSDTPSFSPEYYRSLSTKQMAAGCVFLDEDSRVLLVKPTYKESWDLPGGSVEAGESPLEAAHREVLEELGLDHWPVRLLAVDYRRAVEGVRDDGLRFVFLGGTLTAAETAAIQLAADELSEWKFVGLDELDRFVIPSMARRLRSCVNAVDVCYLEEGSPPVHA